MFGYPIGYSGDMLDQLERMRRELDAAFSEWPRIPGIRSVAAGSFPAVNAGVSPERVDVYVFAPGLDPKTLDVSLQQNLLSIAGERTVSRPDNVQVYRRERFSGSFRRTMSLPDDVDPDHVTATYRDGVLHISVQRREEVRPRQIQVQ